MREKRTLKVYTCICIFLKMTLLKLNCFIYGFLLLYIANVQKLKASIEADQNSIDLLKKEEEDLLKVHVNMCKGYIYMYNECFLGEYHAQCRRCIVNTCMCITEQTFLCESLQGLQKLFILKSYIHVHTCMHCTSVCCSVVDKSITLGIVLLVWIIRVLRL